VAERLFLEKGFNATSVREIASEAGYTVGAVYSAFSNKAELVIAVDERRRAREQAIWRVALESASNSTAATAMAEAFSSTMPEMRWIALCHEMCGAASHDARLRDESAEAYCDWKAHFVSILAPISASSPLPLDRLAAIILRLFEGSGWASLHDPDATDATVFRDAVAVLLGLPLEPVNSVSGPSERNSA